jgi:hypothetical protein
MRPVAQRGGAAPASFWAPGEGLAWVSGLVLMLSAFMGWYSGEAEGITFAVIGWHTGVIGKLVFVLGVATLVFLGLRATGTQLPPTVPAGIVLAVLGAVGTILVLIRVISIPDEFAPAGRGVGIWIGLASAVLLILAGLLKAADEV